MYLMPRFTALRTIRLITFLFFLVGCTVILLVSGRINSIRALEESDVETTFSSKIVVRSNNEADVTITVVFNNVADSPTILTSYDLFIGDVLPKEIVALHDEEELTTRVYESRGSVIRVSFNESLLRASESYQFDVSYSVEHFLLASGGAYDVELPLFRSSETAKVEQIELLYPSLYGPVNYASASFNETETNDRYNVLFNDLTGVERLFVSLGTQRRFSIAIERALVNEGDGYVQQTMILPPDTRSQTLLLTSVSDFPSSAILSDEGNYVLTYDVPPEDTHWVRMQGMLIEKIPQRGSEVLTSSERDLHLDTRSPIWRIDDVSLLSGIESSTAGMTKDEIAKEIYDYTLEELVLSENFRDLHGGEYRKGAEVALKTYKNASVEDYADVFVALCRHFDVPARIVAGYVFPYSVSGSGLGMFHVWPQYWSETFGWVSVDPAYEAYTGIPQGDYVGLQRVIVALSYDSMTSESYPETTENIMITGETVAPATEVRTTLDVPDIIQSGALSEGLISVRNVGNGLLPIDSVMATETGGLTVTFEETGRRELVLPGEEVSYRMYIQQPDWYVSGKRDVTVEIVSELPNGTQRSEATAHIQVEPLWWVVPLSWLITILAFLLTVGAVWSGAKFGKKAINLFSR